MGSKNITLREALPEILCRSVGGVDGCRMRRIGPAIRPHPIPTCPTTCSTSAPPAAAFPAARATAEPKAYRAAALRAAFRIGKPLLPNPHTVGRRHRDHSADDDLSVSFDDEVPARSTRWMMMKISDDNGNWKKNIWRGVRYNRNKTTESWKTIPRRPRSCRRSRCDTRIRNVREARS